MHSLESFTRAAANNIKMQECQDIKAIKTCLINWLYQRHISSIY